MLFIELREVSEEFFLGTYVLNKNRLTFVMSYGIMPIRIILKGIIGRGA